MKCRSSVVEQLYPGPRAEHVGTNLSQPFNAEPLNTLLRKAAAIVAERGQGTSNSIVGPVSVATLGLGDVIGEDTVSVPGQIATLVRK